MNLEQLIQSFFRNQIDQHQQALIKATQQSAETDQPNDDSDRLLISNDLPVISEGSVLDLVDSFPSKEAPWEAQVPPDSIKIDLQEKIDKYAIPPQKVNPYDGNEGKLKHRHSAYLEQLSIKNHPKKGLKASI
jgi:hypothetical protein